MTLHEPATLVTDYLLAMLAAGLAWHLRRRSGRADHSKRWWAAALGFTAGSALAGGTYHGFGPELPTLLADLLWRATLLLISLAGAAMLFAFAWERAQAGRRRLWTGVAVAKLGLFASLILIKGEFVVAIVDYGLAMLVLAIAALIQRPSWRAPLLTGIALSILAAAIQQAGWGISERFNHNDLYHLVQGFALVFFYRAANRFETAPI